MKQAYEPRSIRRHHTSVKQVYTYHTPDDDDLRSETSVNVVELEHSEVEHDQVDGVDVPGPDEVFRW